MIKYKPKKEAISDEENVNSLQEKGIVEKGRKDVHEPIIRANRKARKFFSHDIKVFPRPSEALSLLGDAIGISEIVSKVLKDEKIEKREQNIAKLMKPQKYTDNLPFDDFIEDELIQDGMVRNLEIVGEAVKNIPEAIKNKKPEIEWQKIAGLRDILIHAYFGIDVDIVWNIVKNKIPKLKKEILEVLSKLGVDE